MRLEANWDDAQLRAVVAKLRPEPMRRAMKKAGITALRDMKSETSKRVRQYKRLKAGKIKETIDVVKPKGRGPINGMEWQLNMTGKPVPLYAYPHRRTPKGVAVKVNKGKTSLVRSAFVARMRSGHVGIFKRKGKTRLKIRELYGSRPVDVMLKEGEAIIVLVRGRNSFGRTWERVLPMELDKG